MKDCSRVQSVLELIPSLLNTREPLDETLRDYFASRRYMGSKDRKAVQSMFYEVLRNYGSLSWNAANFQKAGQISMPRLLILGYLKDIQKLSLDQVQALFTGETYGPSPLSPDELEFLQTEAPNMPSWVTLEIPEWIHQKLTNQWTESEMLQELESLNQPAPTDLRVNTLKINRQALMLKFLELGIETEPLDSTPEALRCHSRIKFTNLPFYHDGLFEIQDEGSQRLTRFTKASPGECVVDFCAGAGGKTLDLGTMMENQGKIFALDISKSRLEKGITRATRAGLTIVHHQALVNLRDPYLATLVNCADKVLVDAPCTGSGTWRRDPTLKWRLTPKDFNNLLDVQAEIVEAALPLVKPEGLLVYATCSIFAEENEDQVTKLLKNHSNFQLVETEHFSPFHTKTDGFFVSVLKRLN